MYISQGTVTCWRARLLLIGSYITKKSEVWKNTITGINHTKSIIKKPVQKPAMSNDMTVFIYL